MGAGMTPPRHTPLLCLDQNGEKCICMVSTLNAVLTHGEKWGAREQGLDKDRWFKLDVRWVVTGAPRSWGAIPGVEAVFKEDE